MAGFPETPTSHTERRDTLFFLVAGEESGDLHGARLIREMSRLSPDIRFFGIGGDKMAAEGMEILFHARDLAMMGFSEVIRHLPFLFSVMRKTLAWIRMNRPHRVILIDYPGFNLRLARKLKALKVPVTYFILPQVWAWKEKRIEILRKFVDQRISIMPFEPAWFTERNLEVDFVGHPFAEKKGMNSVQPENDGDDQGLLLLPGSRQQEIDRHWPVFLKTAKILRKRIPEITIAVGKAPGVIIEPFPDWLRTETGSLINSMGSYSAALVSSGTATLEAAVAGLPEVVCYRLSGLSWFLVKLLVRVPHASIVNLIANRTIIPELLQNEMTTDRILREITPLLSDTPVRNQMIKDYAAVRESLGSAGVYERAATLIVTKSTG